MQTPNATTVRMQDDDLARLSSFPGEGSSTEGPSLQKARRSSITDFQRIPKTPRGLSLTSSREDDEVGALTTKMGTLTVTKGPSFNDFLAKCEDMLPMAFTITDKEQDLSAKVKTLLTSNSAFAKYQKVFATAQGRGDVASLVARVPYSPSMSFTDYFRAQQLRQRLLDRVAEVDLRRASADYVQNLQGSNLTLNIKDKFPSQVKIYLPPTLKSPKNGTPTHGRRGSVIPFDFSTLNISLTDKDHLDDLGVSPRVKRVVTNDIYATFDPLVGESRTLDTTLTELHQRETLEKRKFTDASLKQLVEQFPNTETLDISFESPLTKEGFLEIRKLKKLKNLFLGGGITNDLAEKLFAGMPQLKSLTFSSTPAMLKKDQKTQGSIIGIIAKHLKNLEYLNFPIFVDSDDLHLIPQLKSLRTLIIAIGHITDLEKLEMLNELERLAKNTSPDTKTAARILKLEELTKLKKSDPAVAIEIARLEALGKQQNRTAIAEISKLQGLRKLKIKLQRSIKEADAEAMKEKLATLKNLEVLHIDGDDFDDDGLKALQHLKQKNPRCKVFLESKTVVCDIPQGTEEPGA